MIPLFCAKRKYESAERRTYLQRAADTCSRNVMSPRLKDGVGIVMLNEKLNDLEADVISYYANTGEYAVKLRGSDKVVRLSEDNLFDLSKHSDENAIEEKFRRALLQEGEMQTNQAHVEEQIMAMRLADEFTFIVLYHTDRIGYNALPEDQPQRALTRFMMAYYVGLGHIKTGGRGLTSFHLAMRPFYIDVGEGSFTTFQAETTGGVINWCRNMFLLEDSSILLFRAFAFAQHRLDF